MMRGRIASSDRPFRIALAPRRVARRRALRDHPRPYPGRVPGHERDHRGARRLRHHGRPQCRPLGRQDLRRIADVDQLRPRRGDRFRRHARGLRAPLDRHRFRHARGAGRRVRQARHVAVGRPRDRRATLAVGARHPRRRERQARGGRLEVAFASGSSTAPSSTSTGRRSTNTRSRSTTRSISS